MQSEQVNELATALAKAQGIMKAAAYNRINPHFKSRYADLASVWEAIRAPLSSNGLSIIQTQEPINGVGFYLRTTLFHTSGQWVSSMYPLPEQVAPQALGSALTYARRYSLSSIVGIASDEDDDANEAQKTKPQAAQQKGNAEIVRKPLAQDLNDQIPEFDAPNDSLPSARQGATSHPAAAAPSSPAPAAATYSKEDEEWLRGLGRDEAKGGRVRFEHWAKIQTEQDERAGPILRKLYRELFPK